MSSSLPVVKNTESSPVVTASDASSGELPKTLTTPKRALRPPRLVARRRRRGLGRARSRRTDSLAAAAAEFDQFFFPDSGRGTTSGPQSSLGGLGAIDNRPPLITEADWNIGPGPV